MAEFRMPSLGADMDEGTVTRWLVKPGDAVKRGDIVAVVETDKADVEVEVFENGVVEDLLVPEGAKVAVGTPLAHIATGGERAPGRAPAKRRRRKAATAAAAPPAVPETHWQAPPVAPHASPVVRRHAAEMGVDLAVITGTGSNGSITRADVDRAAAITPAVRTPSTRRAAQVSPRARRRARELGVDAATIAGTGPGGAVIGSDVEAASGAAATEPSAPTPLVPPAVEHVAAKAIAMRAAIARAMARSKREIPHYYLATDIDFSRSRAFLDERNGARPVTERLLPAVLLLKATALAVHETPELNGVWVDDAFRASEAVHLGVAISLRTGGLVAPAIHDADGRDLDDLMAALRDLVRRARSYSLRASEMSDPTITVTNLGELGVQVVHGVIYPPQVALVGFGAIAQRPWAVDGMVGAHPVVTVTLAADHRASDGAQGARLLTRIARHLQEPEQL